MKKRKSGGAEEYKSYAVIYKRKTTAKRLIMKTEEVSEFIGDDIRLM